MNPAILAFLATLLLAGPSSGGSGAAEPFEVPPDRSMLPDDYARLGVPGHDRTWSGTDMVQAARELSALGKKKPQRLPRYNSERSGLVFSRIVEPENLAVYRDRSLPLDARFQQALSHVQASSDLHRVYVDAFLKKSVADSEVIEMTGSMLRVVVMMFDLADELAPTLSKADPAQAKRLAGLDQMKQGFSKVIFAALRMMSEKHTRASERVRLVHYLVEVLPSLAPRMSRETCVEIRDRIVAIAGDPELPALHPPVDELKTLVQGLVPDAPPPSPGASASPSPVTTK